MSGRKIIEGLREAAKGNLSRVTIGDQLWVRAKAGPADRVTRFEVVDESGRSYVRNGVTVELSYQEEGRTLKVFVQERPSDQRKGAVKGRSQIKNPITGTWTKRDDKSGKFMEVKTVSQLFKGIRRKKA